MASELRQKILEVEDIQIEIVPVTEWDVDIEVRGMSGLERAGFLRRSTDKEGEVAFERFYPELLIATCFEPPEKNEEGTYEDVVLGTGEKLFEPADRDTLNSKSGAALERIAQVGQRLSGLGQQDVEEAEGNSNGSPKNAST